jgi:hypothetical protein
MGIGAPFRQGWFVWCSDLTVARENSAKLTQVINTGVIIA